MLSIEVHNFATVDKMSMVVVSRERPIMAKKRFHDGDYAGLNGARKEEARDFSMLSEDKSACANMPQDVKYHAWPKTGHYADYSLDDTIRGIDKQMDEDGAQMRRRKGGNKW